MKFATNKMTPKIMTITPTTTTRTLATIVMVTTTPMMMTGEKVIGEG